MHPATKPVKFKCAACGILLTAPPSQAAVSGPCPACGAWITAPENHDPAPVSARKKGRITADSAIDHAHLEKRESLQTLKILALFALATACCLAAAWFLNQWIAR
jgi:predicted ATP-dependent serine protease